MTKHSITNRLGKNAVNRFIFTANDKCRKTILSCETDAQIESAIDMCNMVGKVVCGLLNAEDYKFISSKFNIHRRWCKRSFAVLNASLSELDALITERRQYIENHQMDTNTVGFK